MSHTRTLALGGAGLLTAVGLIASAQSAPEASKPVQRWEHMALTVDLNRDDVGAGLSGRINAAGDNGWEMVCVENFTENSNTTKTVYYFKRPR